MPCNAFTDAASGEGAQGHHHCGWAQQQTAIHSCTVFLSLNTGLETARRKENDAKARSTDDDEMNLANTGKGCDATRRLNLTAKTSKVPVSLPDRA
ncbi:hypothetical protein [Actinacidiphila glaucinigra]|uniref:hypothetical protein n=1 Tax=Actinacidiphila glaucinigra TaxID=235986 RepID=UPI003D919D62